MEELDETAAAAAGKRAAARRRRKDGQVHLEPSQTRSAEQLLKDELDDYDLITSRKPKCAAPSARSTD
jgi:hypothetical protein